MAGGELGKHVSCGRFRLTGNSAVHRQKHANLKRPPDIITRVPFTGLCEKVPAKFGEASSVKADGLCIGCLS